MKMLERKAWMKRKSNLSTALAPTTKAEEAAAAELIAIITTWTVCMNNDDEDDDDESADDSIFYWILHQTCMFQYLMCNLLSKRAAGKRVAVVEVQMMYHSLWHPYHLFHSIQKLSRSEKGV